MVDVFQCKWTHGYNLDECKWMWVDVDEQCKLMKTIVGVSLGMWINSMNIVAYMDELWMHI